MSGVVVCCVWCVVCGGDVCGGVWQYARVCVCVCVLLLLLLLLRVSLSLPSVDVLPAACFVPRLGSLLLPPPLLLLLHPVDARHTPLSSSSSTTRCHHTRTAQRYRTLPIRPHSTQHTAHSTQHTATQPSCSITTSALTLNRHRHTRITLATMISHSDRLLDSYYTQSQ